MYGPDMRSEDGERALAVLLARHGTLTRVTTLGGKVLEVWDVTYGRDIGDRFDHITTNSRPPRDDRPIDFFFTSEVSSIADPAGEVLFIPDAPH
jgi:hypothetical protein